MHKLSIVPRLMALGLSITVLTGAIPWAEGEQWLCEASRGTAYEYSSERDHWLTRVFPVEERWLLQQLPGTETPWLVSRVGDEEERFACTEHRGGASLRCGPAGELEIDLDSGLFSVSLERLEGQIARTAVGRCGLQ